MLLAGLAGSGKNESISSLLKNPDGEVKQNGDIRYHRSTVWHSVYV
jgi:hypothetical protein